MPKTKRSAFDCKHVKRVSAYAVLFNGEFAGKIVGDFSDNPSGSVATVTVCIYSGPLKDMPSVTAKSGGYGYDKFSQSVRVATQGFLDCGNCDDWDKALRNLGYEIHQVC